MPMRNGEPEYRRRLRQETKDKEEKSDREWWQRENHKNVKRILAFMGSIYSQRERHKKDEDRHWRYERLLQAGEILALVAAAVVGVAAIIVGNDDSKRTRTIMQNQLNAFEGEARIRLRSYISIAATRTPLVVGQSVMSTVNIRAGGQTPATDVRAQGHTGDQRFPFQREDFVFDQPGQGANAVSLNPGDQVQLQAASPPISQLAFDTLRRPDAPRRFYMWGRVYYRDVFGCHRWQNYCFSVNDTNGSNPPDTAPCPEYNNSEGEPGECPKE